MIQLGLFLPSAIGDYLLIELNCTTTSFKVYDKPICQPLVIHINPLNIFVLDGRYVITLVIPRKGSRTARNMVCSRVGTACLGPEHMFSGPLGIMRARVSCNSTPSIHSLPKRHLKQPKLFKYMIGSN